MSNRLLVGRYELIEKIGEGGMAIVYKARCRLLNRYVAIKVLRPEYTKDEAFIQSFRRESQAAAGLSHPNIVSVYDVGQEGNIHFIVMELIDGKTLSDVISEKGKLDYKEAISITKQIAAALSLAHKNQIVHRDVKPHNILITNTGVAKLTDFGIAKAISASTIMGGDDKIMGSVHYFSPEQARGAYVDDRTDIYSLGIVLFELLTGRVPFDGDNPVTIALMHINDSMPKLSEYVKGLPPQLDKIIAKATDKYQNNRYSSIDDMIEDLDSLDYISKVMGEKAFINTDTSREKREETKQEDLSKERNEHKKEDINRRKKTTKEKSNKSFIAIVVVLGLIVVGACALALGSMLGLFNKESNVVNVPRFIGSTFEEAAIIAEEYEVKIVEGEEVFSSEYEAGIITSQSPSEGFEVSKGKVITVYVSKGKKNGVVPKIINMDYLQANDYLKTMGFEIGLVVKEENYLPENTILSQSVAWGTTAPSGTKIDVVVSDGKGKEMVKVPNLIGKTPDEANAMLTRAGLAAGMPSYEERDDVPQNLIFWQEVPADTEVETGTAIAYKISKGEMPEGSGSGTGDESEVEDETEPIE